MLVIVGAIVSVTLIVNFVVVVLPLGSTDVITIATKFTINVTDTIAPTITNITDQTKEVNTPIESVKVNATDNSGEVLSNTY